VTAGNLWGELERSGIGRERLLFAPTLPAMADHLARYRQADLAVDTYPYGSHSTAMDALWAGCPVITLSGETFASRVAASQLNTLGLPQLVTTSLEEYRDRILHFATHRSELAALRAQLVERRDRSPLFDTAAFTKHLEAAYRRMSELFTSGRGPETIDFATAALDSEVQ